MQQTAMRVLKLLLSIILITTASILDDVQRKRDQLYKNEAQMMFGNDIYLTECELKANETIMNLKLQVLDEGFYNPKSFNLSKPFFEYRDAVKNTKLFKIIQKMPKGALLHAHDTGMLGSDYLLKVTYKENLYICFSGRNVSFYFSKSTPKSPCTSKWQLMKDARYSSGNVPQFDQNLKRYFIMLPESNYTDINSVWSRFQNYFTVTAPLIQFMPVWEEYFNDTLNALRRDGVMYLEIRSVLPPLYDLEGNVYQSVATAEIYKKVADRFIKTYPDFFGAKLIYAPSRHVNRIIFRRYLKIAREIKRKMPSFLAGFDLVGQEDLGPTLKYFMSDLVEVKKEFNLFLHAGETKWNGESTDENLFDAIALGTKRIGHGYGIIKHPILMQQIKQQDIPLEVNLISNLVLNLLTDVRNHLLAAWLAQDLPIVLSSDDPGVWDAEPLSHDFYVAFVAVANRHADLRLLKKLALNSLYYSTYPDVNTMVQEFERRWKIFINWILDN